VDLHDVIALGLGALGRLEHLVLQTTGRDLDTFFGLVGSQERLTGYLRFLAVFLALSSAFLRISVL
ncbi:MAG: hypothetical protein RJB04_2409, partial [Verrucomicrobiota bacterium]